MKKVLLTFNFTFLVLTSLTLLWFFINNLFPLKNWSGVIIAVIAGLLAFLLLNKKANYKTAKLFRKLRSLKYFVATVVIISIIASLAARFLIFYLFSYEPVSDPSTFYESAAKIAHGEGMIGDTYTAFFPYLAAYNGLLGVVTSIISDPWLAVITLNTTLDFITAYAIYGTLRFGMGKNSKLATLGFILWILSPFSILFSTISIPISAVNAFIALSVMLATLMLRSVLQKKLTQAVGFSLLLSIGLGIGNAFRPVFVIFLIALLLIFLYIVLSSKAHPKDTLLLSSLFAIILSVFLLFQQFNLLFVERATALQPATNASGWSVFVGANRESSGKWNIEDESRMDVMCRNLDRNTCHEELMDAGIERFKSYGLFESLNLMVNKLYVLSSNQTDIYNADGSIVGYENSSMQKILAFYSSIFLGAITFSAFLYLFSILFIKRFRKESTIILFISLLILGFFLSTAFVETSARYAQVLYPIFILLAALGMGLLGHRNTAK